MASTRPSINLVLQREGLEDADGIVAEDIANYTGYGLPLVEFNLRPRSAGWPAAQVQIQFYGLPLP